MPPSFGSAPMTRKRTSLWWRKKPAAAMRIMRRGTAIAETTQAPIALVAGTELLRPPHLQRRRWRRLWPGRLAEDDGHDSSGLAEADSGRFPLFRSRVAGPASESGAWVQFHGHQQTGQQCCLRLEWHRHIAIRKRSDRTIRGCGWGYQPSKRPGGRWPEILSLQAVVVSRDIHSKDRAKARSFFDPVGLLRPRLEVVSKDTLTAASGPRRKPQRLLRTQANSRFEPRHPGHRTSMRSGQRAPPRPALRNPATNSRFPRVSPGSDPSVLRT